MIRLALQSPAPPAEVLACIHDHAAQWRASEIPEWAQRAGIIGVECRVRGTQYRLWYTRSGFGFPGPLRWLDLRGTAQPALNGGTRLALSVAYRPRWYAALPAVLMLGLTTLAVADGSPWPVALLVVGWLGFVGWLLWDANHGLTRRSEREADYLIRRIEVVLEQLAAARRRPGEPTSMRTPAT